MTILTKNIKVVPYNPQWPHMFEEESSLIKKALGNHCIMVHHIGSTSVPGLSAKEDLDILCIVDSLPVSLALQESGYVFKGEFNIPLRSFFSKNTSHSKVNLHVVEPDHGFISLNLCFRDYLRTNEEARLAYGELKHRLVQDPTSFERVNGKWARYTLKKNTFIKDLLEKANFDGLAVNFCTHDEEWKSYHRIKEEQILTPIGISYDYNHKSLQAQDHYHLVFYKGINIMGIAHMEFLNDQEAILKSLAVDPPYKGQETEIFMKNFLIKWVRYHGRQGP